MIKVTVVEKDYLCNFCNKRVFEDKYTLEFRSTAEGRNLCVGICVDCAFALISKLSKTIHKQLKKEK